MMTIAQLLDASRKRIPFPVMTAMLRICGLPSSQGWQRMIEVLLVSYASNKEYRDNFDALKKLYYEHLLVGEKSVKIFHVEKSRIDEIITLLNQHPIERVGFHDTYPFPLNDEKLAKMDNEPHLIEVRADQEQGNVSLIFCSKRFFSERKEIDIDELTNETRHELQVYDEIFGIKKYTRQFFDVITFWPEKEMVEIRVDMGVGRGLNTKERGRAFSSNIKTLLELLSLIEEQPKDTDLFKNGISLFPAISALYHSNEGKVVEIGFTTNAGSTKAERMRKKSSIDLRQEIYHKAGKEAVKHITLYRLGILWTIPRKNDTTVHPGLFLPGHVSDLSNPTQSQLHAIVRQCSSTNDYLLIFEKLLQYLNASNQ
jgi:hypothetical protein